MADIAGHLAADSFGDGYHYISKLSVLCVGVLDRVEARCKWDVSCLGSHRSSGRLAEVKLSVGPVENTGFRGR